MERHGMIPNHQFGFQSKHATIEQTHGIVERISNDMQADRYCTAFSLNVSQAFNKVWHQELLHKIKNSFQTDIHNIIRYYVVHRTCRCEEVTQLKEINFEISRGNVLKLLLYLFVIHLIFQSLWTPQQ